MYKQLDGLSAYQFRDDGEVVSLQRREPRVLLGGVDKDGYRKFVLIDDTGRRRHVRRASLICEAFHGPRPPGYVTRHLDGSRTNDAPSNLEWSSQAENIADKLAHGTIQRGSRNPRSTLTEDAVRYIRAHPEMTPTNLARGLGSTLNAVWAARHGRTWGWVE